MGACLAIFLARRGEEVVLFDAAHAPLTGASRWNEGKIHLGYLYANDQSLSTAAHLVTGGLAFAPLMEELTGRPLKKIAPGDDLYLIHARSVVPPDQAGAYFARVSQLVRERAGGARYLKDCADARAYALSAAELGAVAGEAIVAGFRVPERSLCTVTLADQLVDALAAESRIVHRMGTLVREVAAIDGDEGAWRVHGEAFDYVVNALWHGRLAVDATAGLAPPPGWSHRYRVSAFIRTTHDIVAPSAVVAVGPFGDFKAYDARTFYASWYSAGLLADSGDVAPPSPPTLSGVAKRDIAQRIASELGAHLPIVREVFAATESVAIEGGYVFAQGHGALDDPAATLHRRDRFGVRRKGRYISIDTGKYSTAPWLAHAVAQEIAR